MVYNTCTIFGSLDLRQDNHDNAFFLKLPRANLVACNILNHTSNTNEYNIYIGSSVVMQFYQKLKHLFMLMKVELHQSITHFQS